MPFYERGNVRIHYEEAGSGFPLFLIAGGGLDSEVAYFNGTAARGKGAPFDVIGEFKSEYRCIAMDLRTAQGGQSFGPLEVERPWDCLTDDQLGLLDYLGVDRFLVMGFCVGNPLIWNLLKRAPGRIVAAVSAQPSGFHPEYPDRFYKTKLVDWGPAMCARQPGTTMEAVDQFLRNMYFRNPDFVYTVTRDFARACQTPLLVLPDDTKAHPYQVSMDMVHLAPNAQVSLYPWLDSRENTALAVRHVRTFLKANRPPAA